jgi:hypothetical protein
MEVRVLALMVGRMEVVKKKRRRRRGRRRKRGRR